MVAPGSHIEPGLAQGVAISVDLGRLASHSASGIGHAE